MKNKESHIYVSADQIDFPDFSEFLSVYTVKIWQPSLLKFVPPGFPNKYIMYWFAHYFGVFKNRNYTAVLIYDHFKLVSSMLVVPAYFKWPFMGETDIQYTFSVTKKEYRGKGLNTLAKLYIRYLYSEEGIKIWCIVDPDNVSNIKVLKKVGLKFYCSAHRRPIRFFPLLYQIIPEIEGFSK